MRIIAGNHRGRILRSPPDQGPTRPITDRAKEDLFNRLVSFGLLSTEDESGNPTPFHVVDVFSGTGSMGLECLSRGASSAAFVELDRDVGSLLLENVREMGMEESAHLISISALSPSWIRMLHNTPLRLCFFDPPYPMVRDEAQFAQILERVRDIAGVLELGGVVELRTPVGIAVPEIEGCDGPVSFDVGTMSFHLWQRPLEDEAGELR